MIAKTRTPRSDALRVTFSLPADRPSERVFVVGDFNNWDPGPHELRRRSNGRRTAIVELPPGHRSRFRYVTAAGHWFDDGDADAYEPNPHGGVDGVVTT